MSFFINAYGVVERVGSGALQALTAAVSGIGHKIITIDSAISAGQSNISGAGYIINGGALRATTAATSGAGFVRHTGTGALTSSNASIDGGLFNPESVSGLSLWLDADDISTLYQDSSKTTPVTSDDDPLGCWEDKSDNGYDFVQTSASLKPAYKTSGINTSPSIYSDSTDWLINTTKANWKFLHGANPHSIFVVFKADADIGTWGGLIGNNSYEYYSIGFSLTTHSSSNSAYYNVSEDGLDWVAYLSAPTNTFYPGTAYIVQADYHYGAGDDVELFSDGVSVASGESVIVPSNTADSTYDLQIFTNGNTEDIFKGYIAEIIVYDNVISAGDRASLTAYLKDKWGIT